MKKETKENIESIAIFIIIGAFVVMMSLLFGSCRTLYVDKEHVITDTLVVRDSVNITDTVVRVRTEKEVVEHNYYHEISKDYSFGKMLEGMGIRVDTVKIIERITVGDSRYKEVADSLVRLLSYYEAKDSLSSHSESDKEKAVVEKGRTWSEKALMVLGHLFLYLLVIAIVAAATFLLIRKIKGK